MLNQGKYSLFNPFQILYVINLFILGSCSQNYGSHASISIFQKVRGTVFVSIAKFFNCCTFCKRRTGHGIATLDTSRMSLKMIL